MVALRRTPNSSRPEARVVALLTLEGQQDPQTNHRTGDRRLLRILTYNVHRCRGTDGQFSPARIAKVIALHEPDIVALQELDVGRSLSGGVDQAHAIAHELGMAFHFHPALRVVEELYGDAILTARPCTLVRAGPLPGIPGWRRLEPRGALWVSIDIGGIKLQVINTHLGLIARERLAQVETLLGPEWLGHPACREPKILLGDFNSVPRSRVYRRLTGDLIDAQDAPGVRRTRATYPARLPLLRIDHVFIGGDIEVIGSAVPRTPLTRIASDHLPLVLDLRITCSSARRPAAPAERAVSPAEPVVK